MEASCWPVAVLDADVTVVAVAGGAGCGGGVGFGVSFVTDEVEFDEGVRP